MCGVNVKQCTDLHMYGNSLALSHFHVVLTQHYDHLIIQDYGLLIPDIVLQLTYY